MRLRPCTGQFAGFDTRFAWSETLNSGIPSTSRFDDYRVIGGISIPYTVVANTAANGDVVTKIRSIRMDVPIPDTAFKPKGP